MTAKEIFELRNLGNTEKAYEEARHLYATDKSPYSCLAMFWTAVDMLRLLAKKGQLTEANKILLALERLQPNVSDKEGRARDAARKCRELLMQKNSTQQQRTAEKQETEISNANKSISTKVSASSYIEEENEDYLTDEESEHTLMGKWGEKVAANYLFRKGYEIIDHDWHSGHRDIDIVAQQGNTIVFVEVKTRRNRFFGDPQDAIDYWKRYNLRRAINHYVKFYGIDNYRFDIITVVGSLNCETPEITHLEDINIQEIETRHKKRRR